MATNARAVAYHAAAAALRLPRLAADRPALIRAHRDHCWRARFGNAAWHQFCAAALRRRLARG